ncbi:hypothetical protein KR059_005474, partial [Drosophila kikkawai]
AIPPAGEGFFCTICNVVTEGEILTTPCRHQFHRECLLTWLDSNETCPLCRQHLTRSDINPESVEARAQALQAPSAATAGSSRSGAIPRTRPATRNSARNVQNPSNLPRPQQNTPNRESV